MPSVRNDVEREAIRQGCEVYRPIYGETPMRHVTVNIVIGVDGDEPSRTPTFCSWLRASSQAY
jgi:hypothetical protein